MGTKSIPRLLKHQPGNAAPVGINSIAWTKENSSEYVIGTETGFVLRCSIARAMEINKSTTTSKTTTYLT